MAADEQAGRLMDATAIMRELGVSRAQADKIIRWCGRLTGVVRPADGARKAYVYRADVEEWLARSTERAA